MHKKVTGECRKCSETISEVFRQVLVFILRIHQLLWSKISKIMSKLIIIDRDQDMHMIKRLIVYANYDSSIMSMVFVDHIEGVLTGFWGYYKILARFMVQNIQNYIKVDHDWSRWRYEFMIKRLILHVHYDSGIMSGAFSDHIGGV